MRQCCCTFTTDANFGYVVVKYFDLFEENRRRFDFPNSFQPNFIFKINKIKFLDSTGAFDSFSFLFFFLNEVLLHFKTLILSLNNSLFFGPPSYFVIKYVNVNGRSII